MNRQFTEEEIPVKYRGIFKRAYAGNRPAAVRAKCLDCCAFDRKEVGNCTVVSCPLHCIRPYRIKTPKNTSESDALKK